MAEHNELGKKGESAAVEFLKDAGYTVLEQNYRFGKAEIDIVCKEAKTIIFCEVKTRSTDYFGPPEESVSKKKIKLIKLAAGEYLYQNKLDTEVRFDIISIVDQKGVLKIYHIKDAFFQEEDEDTYN